MPEPVLLGRDAEKLAALAESSGGLKWSTDRDAALADPAIDALFRRQRHRRAARARPRRVCRRQARLCRKARCRKPRGRAEPRPRRRARRQEGRRRPGQAVPARPQETAPPLRRELFRPGPVDQARFRLVGIRRRRIPAQRPSWNYRQATGGGLILDMFAHWRYIFDRLLGPIKSVSCHHATLQPRRIDETGRPYDVDVEDHAFALFELEGGIPAQISLVLGQPRQARRSACRSRSTALPARPSPGCIAASSSLRSRRRARFSARKCRRR